MDEISHSDDATWLLTAAALILTMQTGFALLETGYSTKNNEINILMKNVCDVVVGGMGFWMVGFGIAFGTPSTPFSGCGQFFTTANGDDAIEDGWLYAKYIF